MFRWGGTCNTPARAHEGSASNASFFCGIPAKAGIQGRGSRSSPWNPAFRGNDEEHGPVDLALIRAPVSLQTVGAEPDGLLELEQGQPGQAVEAEAFGGRQ